MSHLNLGANAFYLACHAALLLSQVFLGIKYKTWGFLFAAFCGHVLEIVGYAGRVQMSKNGEGFLMQVVSLTIGPAFFSAAIYLCLARIVVVFGTHLSRFQPRVYTITFMIFDFLALVLQASGGSLLGSDNPSTMDTGLKVMQAGLSIHLIAIVAFIILAGEFAYRVLRPSKPWDATFSDLQTSKRFRHFLIGTTVSTACILVRTAYRVAELSSGLHSDIANNEAALMVFEGAMVLIAAACLAVYHPGVAFEGRWDEANFELSEGEKEKELELA